MSEESLTEAVAKLFHETYERLAPEYHYQTRPQSRVAWEDVPENNKQLMIAVADHVLSQLVCQANYLNFYLRTPTE